MTIDNYESRGDFRSGSILPVVALFMSVCLWGWCQPAGAVQEGKDRESTIAPEKAERLAGSDLLWYDGSLLQVEGKGWTDTEHFYERLPARAKKTVTPAVWGLSKHTAGICLRFRTNSSQVAADWDGGGAMVHMAATGVSGLDLYKKQGGKWVFCGVGRPGTQRTRVVLTNNPSGRMQEYLLYLPLYNRVTRILVGIRKDALMQKGPARLPGVRPLVFYGTSITQGGCASRCGMCHPALLGRWLGREVINLGFSGSGKMEPAMARLLGELNAAIYILDCLPNMNAAMVNERVVPFVHILHKLRPQTPILFIEEPRDAEHNPKNIALRKAYETLRREGTGGLYYHRGDNLLGHQENPTVDGVHPTDLGFFRMAKDLLPDIKAILQDAKR